jgi:hypothetical protein
MVWNVRSLLEEISNDDTYLKVMRIGLFIIAKSLIRFGFLQIPKLSNELQIRLMILIEHAFFTSIGWYVLVIAPHLNHVESWFFNTKNNWVLPPLPFASFGLFYEVKLATHLEDVVHMIVTWTSPLVSSGQEGERVGRDRKMDIHHLSTAALCIGSYFFGYAKIGSLGELIPNVLHVAPSSYLMITVMFLHDASDVPLDLLRLSTTLDIPWLQITSYILTVISWVYWRLWFLPMRVMYSIAFESASLLFPIPCKPGECTWAEYPLESLRERVPFLCLLGTLLYLHVVWFWLILLKGMKAYREMTHKRE